VRDLDPGLYEVLVTEALQARLDARTGAASDSHDADVRALRAAEAADRIALHCSRVIEQALDAVDDTRRVAVGVEVARALIARLAELTRTDTGATPIEAAHVLHAVRDHLPDGRPRAWPEPLIPLLDTTLHTNAPGEPRLVTQLQAEIESADAIDVVMAFVRRSGIAPLLDGLRRHASRGGRLRVLTTTYTGTTQRAALDELQQLGADVRVSYDVSSTRLHAKGWLFARNSGFSTAYIGSSNLTHSAQVPGREWNVRASAARNPHVLAKFAAVFESYWAAHDFLPYDADQFDRETDRAAPRGATVLLSPIEVSLEPFQERLLELIAVARQRGHHRNLLVAATGTGKTVMAAVDYARVRATLPRARLLFVAHREEILDQARATFCHVLRDHAFGEKWVAGSVPRRFEHVFASVQTLRGVDLDRLAPDHFDVVVVDEFHHAAASSYQRLLDHLVPTELLGLTATPERSDGLPVLHWFDDRIAAELRLWDAIDQHHLAPFLYYGIHDGLDLRAIPWRRGTGYDVEALSQLYTSTDAWARTVLHQTRRLAEEPDAMRALGFCVSIDHARFMARHFNEHGVPAVAVWGGTGDDERRAALRDLADGRIRAVFSVDLFNEGVDVPSVDTVLLLRPTESPTLFLQQLGRGLRLSPGTDKTVCTVVDFVGLHRREFRFDRRFRALLGGTRRDLERAIEQHFPFLPAGCHLELDEKAAEIVLRSIREAIPSRWPAKVAELRSLARDHPDTGLAGYLHEAGLDLTDVYDGTHTWSDLREAADLPVQGAGPHEARLRKAVGRLLHIDDDERITAFRELLEMPSPPAVAALPERQRRLLRMLVASVADQALSKDDSLQDGVDLLWHHPQVRGELAELLGVLDDRIDHLHGPLVAHPDVPLQVHARYTRLEIHAAFGVGAGAKVATWREGVYEVKDAGADLLAFTLDKSSGGFSPTTRYRDYAISRTRIHWESQSLTREDSPTGRRYRTHEALGRSIMLFARMRADDRAFWFLGPARYRGHVGEQPMAVTWELDMPLPGDLFASFAAAVA
jgi:superfamily II DNA or RNA helicase/HKD family nuclease